MILFVLDKIADYWGDGDSLWAWKRGTCCVCGHRTHWVSLSFEVRLCAGTCSDTLWSEYCAALRE